MTDVEVHTPGAVPAIPARSEWDVIQAQAAVLARSGIVPAAYRRKPDDIIAAALFGRTVGFDVPTSLRLIHVVEGRPTFAADALVAMVRRAGHSLSGETGASRAVARGRRADTGDEMTVEWTMDMAKAARLDGKAVWKSYPQSMLWARAVSQLCRMLFADVTLGMAYTPEELDPNVALDAAGNVIDVVEAPDPDEVERARQREARDARMREWAESLDEEHSVLWVEWKAAHPKWFKSDDGRNEAHQALAEIYAACMAGAGAEPFGDEIVDAELVDDLPSSEVVKPEPASSLDDGSSPMATTAMIRKLQIECNALGPQQRADRLAWATVELARQVESFNTLTRDEASYLITVATAARECAVDGEGGAA